MVFILVSREFQGSFRGKFRDELRGLRCVNMGPKEFQEIFGGISARFFKALQRRFPGFGGSHVRYDDPRVFPKAFLEDSEALSEAFLGCFRGFRRVSEAFEGA